MTDPDTERLHEVFRSADSLDEVLEQLDSERTAYEFREAVTAAGREVEVSDDLHGPFFDEKDLDGSSWNSRLIKKRTMKTYWK